MALLSRLPPEGRKRPGNEADKEPDGSGVRQSIRGADPLGKTQKAHGPANPQGKENVPVFPDAPSGMGQCLHHRAVYVEHHGQHAAGDAGQDRPRADQRTAQQIPQPARPIRLLIWVRHIPPPHSNCIQGIISAFPVPRNPKL